MKDLFDIYVEKVKELGREYKITNEVDKHINRLLELSKKYNVSIDDLVCKWFERVFNKAELGHIAYLNLRKELEEQYPDIPQDDMFTTEQLIAMTTMFYQLDQERQEKRAKQEKQQAAQKDKECKGKDKDKGKGKGKGKRKPKKEEIPYYIACLRW